MYVCMYVWKSISKICRWESTLNYKSRHSCIKLTEELQWPIMYASEISKAKRFFLLISTHEILSVNESTVLKFNYSDSFVFTTTLIYKYKLQWVWVQHWHQTHNVRNIFDKFRKVLINDSNDSNHSLKFIVLAVIVAFTIKEKRKRQR